MLMNPSMAPFLRFVAGVSVSAFAIVPSAVFADYAVKNLDVNE